MLYPSMTAITFGIVLLTALAALNWYLWGLTMVPTIHRPLTAQPLGPGGLTQKYSEPMVAAGQEVLPQSGLTAEAGAAPVANASADSHGFKQVA